MNAIKQMQENRLNAQNKFKELGFVFEPAFNVDGLSVNDYNDLSELEVGESTYVGEIGDVVRIA